MKLRKEAEIKGKMIVRPGIVGSGVEIQLFSLLDKVRMIYKNTENNSWEYLYRIEDKKVYIEVFETENINIYGNFIEN